MKKFVKIAMILLMLIVSAAAVTACSSSSDDITGIAVDEANMPQVVFVQGNALDLSKGKLTVTGKQPEQIALGSADVKVSGYNKDTLGKQTLTIEYKGKTTTLDITVVPRMTVKESITEYFVGDEFDDSEGLVDIYNDDGTAFAVTLDDATVTVTGFDSQAVNDSLALTVTYKKDGKEYSTIFTVKVLALTQDNITFTKPRKTAYKSHETELDFTGGYLTLKTPNGNPKYVQPESFDEISGFDPSAATAQNKETALKQTITIKYAGFTFTYDISVTYSNVSVFADMVKPLANLDWSEDIPEITAEQGKAALDAMTLYFNELSTDEIAMISQSDYTSAVRAATVYGYEQYVAETEKFADLFVADSHGDAELTAADRAKAKALCKKMDEANTTARLRQLCDLLGSIADIHGDVKLVGSYTAGAYLTRVIDTADIDWAKSRAEALIEISEILDVVPADWTIEGLEAFDTQLNNAREKLSALAGEKPDIYERYIYNVLSAWRAKDDVFDILFTYYYNMAVQEDENVSKVGRDAVESLIDVRLPGVLEDYYIDFIIAYMQAASQSYDTAPFMAYFRDVLVSEQVVLNSENEMIRSLYEIYGFGERTQELKTIYYGYCGTQFGTNALESMWDAFIDVAYTDEDDATYAGKVEGMFKQLLDLTPAQIAGVLSSFNSAGTPALFPSDDPFATSFTATLVAYYMQTMPEKMIYKEDENGIAVDFGIVFNVLDAVDFFMLRYEQVDMEDMGKYPFLTGFLATVDDINKEYAAFNATDKATFDEHLGFALDKLNEWAALYNEDGTLKTVLLTQQEQEKLTALESAVINDLMSTLMMSLFADVNLVTVSAYDRAATIGEDIMENGSDALKTAYCHGLCSAFGDELQITYESLLWQMRSLYIECLTDYPTADGEFTFDAWVQYHMYDDLRAFVRDAFDFMMAQLDFSAFIDEDEEFEQPYTFTAADVARLMGEYAALGDEERYLFYLLDGEATGLFATGMKEFFAEAFKDNAELAGLAGKLLAFDAQYFADEEETVTWEEIQTAAEALSEEDRALFDTYFTGLYELYGDRFVSDSTPDDSQAETQALAA